MPTSDYISVRNAMRLPSPEHEYELDSSNQNGSPVLLRIGGLGIRDNIRKTGRPIFDSGLRSYDGATALPRQGRGWEGRMSRKALHRKALDTVRDWVSCHPWTMLYIAFISTANFFLTLWVWR